MNNILILVTMSSMSLTRAAAIDDFLLQTTVYNEHVNSFFFTDHLDLLVNISRTSLLMMLPLKTKADRLIPNQVVQ